MAGEHAERRSGEQALFIALEAMNARFYERFSSGFHSTRGGEWKAWHTLFDRLPASPLSVLDVGCGNGRFAAALAAERAAHDVPREVSHYLGLDRCEALLAYARERDLPFPCQWLSWSWDALLDREAFDDLSQRPQDGPALYGRFDLVLLFGVTHHIFSFSRRLQLLHWVSAQLAEGGRLWVSFWDLGAHPRLIRRRLSWEQHRDSLPEDLSPLEENDWLLGWGAHQDTPRYCHWSDAEEVKLISDALTSIDQTLSAELVEEGGLNRYLEISRSVSTTEALSLL